MLPADKSHLKNTIWNLAGHHIEALPFKCRYVLNRRSLVYHLQKRIRRSVYGKIIDMNKKYNISSHGNNLAVIFDGRYGKATTKGSYT